MQFGMDISIYPHVSKSKIDNRDNTAAPYSHLSQIANHECNKSYISIQRWCNFGLFKIFEVSEMPIHRGKKRHASSEKGDRNDECDL